MTSPKLAVKASGFGGRGYRHPETGQLVPSVTTVLKAAAQPGVTQWAVDQTAAFAAANPEYLMGMSQDRAWGYLRWYYKREPKEIYDGLDVRNYHKGVLNDAAEQGTGMHEWAQADVDNRLQYPIITDDNVAHWQMVGAWNKYLQENAVEPMLTEVTVWNATEGYAGTFDGLWVINGKLSLLDIKTSRGIWPDHSRQLAALKNGETYFTEVDGEWIENPWQPVVEQVEEFAFLHIRPDDIDNKGTFIDAYCEYTEAEDLDLYYEGFLGCLNMKKSELAIAARQKGRKTISLS